MYPCIERFVTEADGIVELGVAAGWDKKTCSIAAFDQGGSYGETLWREGWQLCDALAWLDDHLGEGREGIPFEQWSGRESRPPTTHTAWPETKFPRLTKFLRKLRPARCATLGRRPGDSFVVLSKGNPRFQKSTTVFGHPRKLTSLTAMFDTLNAGAS